jgi:hypothetical protein
MRTGGRPMASCILKARGDFTLTEVTLSDGRNIISRAYSVKGRDPAEQRSFGDMGSADVYFDELVLSRLSPN